MQNAVLPTHWHLKFTRAAREGPALSWFALNPTLIPSLTPILELHEGELMSSSPDPILASFVELAWNQARKAINCGQTKWKI
jgi:hypothetical protein